MKNERKRKMLLVLPLLVIPFLTLAFWAMGGGKGKGGEKQNIISGLNPELPNSKLKDDKMTDKLSFYEKADKDSIRLAEEMRSDPYHKEKEDSSKTVPDELQVLTQTSASKFNQKLNLSPYDKVEQAPEQKVMQKLKLLQNELNKNAGKEKGTDESDGDRTIDADRIDNLLNQVNKNDSDDTEINQLSSVMDKILDVQYPQRVKERMNEKSLAANKNVLAVKNKDTADTNFNGFYGTKNETKINQSNAIEAVVNQNQVLVSGAVIKFRLLNDIYIGGTKIPPGNFVFGIVSLNDERLEVEVNSIRRGEDLFNVKLHVYDMDGLPGIYIPGAISREAAKQSADNSLQLLEMSSPDPSLKAQATAAGISSIKNLLSKKVKLVKVKEKEGYRVLLYNK